MKIFADMMSVRHLHLADNIIVLDKSGRAIEQGTFADLRSQNGFVSRLVLHPELLESGKSEVASSTAVSAPSIPKILQGPSANDAADLARKTGDISVYKYYIKSIGWKIGLANLAGVLIDTLGKGSPGKFCQLSRNFS